MLRASNDNDDCANFNNIIITIKDAELYVLEITSSAKDNQKLLNLLSEKFGRSVHRNKYKTKVRLKIRQMNIDTFLNQTL